MLNRGKGRLENRVICWRKVGMHFVVFLYLLGMNHNRHEDIYSISYQSVCLLCLMCISVCSAYTEMIAALFKMFHLIRDHCCVAPNSVTFCDFLYNCFSVLVPSVLWRCWLGGRKGIQPVKTEWWGAGVVICLERGADLHMAQLTPLPLTSVKCRLVLPFWYQLTWVVPEKGR